MFAENLTVTIDGIAKVLTRINQDGYSSEYLLREVTGEYRMKVRNSSFTDKPRARVVDRHNCELVYTIYPVSPAIVPLVRKAYVVYENDRIDDPATSVKFNYGFGGFAGATATITKMVNNES